MFVFTIILGISLYPGYCYKANDAISTQRQARNGQLYYNSANYQLTQNSHYNYEPSQNNNYNYELSQNSNYNYEPSQNSNFNYEPSQNSNYNYEPNQNSNYNYATSQNSNYNYEPSQNSNYNYEPNQNSIYNYATSQNSNCNYEPSQNSNYNYAPSQNSNYNNAPSNNRHYNYAPRQNANYNNKLDFNSLGNVTYAGAGLGLRIPSDRLVYLAKIITRQPYENERYNSQLAELSRNYQTFSNIDSPPIAYKAEIGGMPVPMFREYPKFRFFPPNLPSTSISFRRFENNPRISPGNPSQDQKVVGFGDIGSRNHNISTDASPEDLGFDTNPDPPEMAEREWFLWQVSVFSKEVSPHARVCGGSLVTSSAVISAARCFWSVGPLSTELFAVAAGEASGQANNYKAYPYQRNLRDIRLPPRFRGAASSFQDDLAVAVLAWPLPPALRPVCVSFDWGLDEQLAEDSEVLDKVERWYLDMRNQRVPYISIEECLREAPEDQLRYVTSDKFCAGFRGVKQDRACSPDTGSGLVYYQGSSIPFLRGVASLQLGDLCVSAFTHVARHRAFLLRHVSGLEAECARHYPGAGGVKEGGGELVCNCYC